MIDNEEKDVAGMGLEVELVDVALRIRAWQERMRDAHPKKYSDVQFCGAHPQLGSSKTYHLILDGKLEGLNAERWLPAYKGVLAVLESAGEELSESDIEELTTVQRLRVALPDAMREHGMNRLIVVEGPSGSGKTTAAKLAQARFGAGRVVIVQAVDIWKDSTAAMLRGLARGLGCAGDLPAGSAALFDLVSSRLSVARLCLVIDEAHHLGPRTLNIVKSLVNTTPGEFVLLAMGTLWRNLERSCYEEARQLTQNRLLERIRFSGAEPDDIAKMIEIRCGLDASAANKAAKALRDYVSRFGNLAFVKLMCREARRMAAGSDPDMETIMRAASRVAGSR